MAKASHKANDEDGLDPRCREIDYLLMEAASKSHPRDMDAGRGSVVAIFCNLPLGAKAGRNTCKASGSPEQVGWEEVITVKFGGYTCK